MRIDGQKPPRWLTLGSQLFVLLALGLFFLSIKLDAKSPHFTSLLVPVLFASVLAAVGFHFSYWREARKSRVAIDAENYSRERQFTSIFEHALDGILILDDQSVCRGANPSAHRLLGVDRAGLVGRYFGDFYPDREEFAQNWKSFLSAGHQRGQMRLLCRDKSSVFVDYTSTANYIPGRHVLILCDTTRQKHAETSLQNVEERFRQMADHISDVFYLREADGSRMLYISTAYEKI